MFYSNIITNLRNKEIYEHTKSSKIDLFLKKENRFLTSNKKGYMYTDYTTKLDVRDFKQEI